MILTLIRAQDIFYIEDNSVMITEEFLIKNKKMIKQPGLAELSGIPLPTLHDKFDEDGPELVPSQARAIEKGLKEGGIYKRNKISPRTIKKSPIINAKELWRRSGFEPAIMEAINKERWHRLPKNTIKSLAVLSL